MSNFDAEYNMVKGFHFAFGLDVDAVWSPNLLRLRKKLIEEEYAELNAEWLRVPTKPDLELKETCDLVYVLLGTAISLGLRNVNGVNRLSISRICSTLSNAMHGDSPELVYILEEDVSASVNWLIEDTNMLYNFKFHEAFKRVHESNMSKLVDGKVFKNSDGKVLKGPNYKPPYLGDLV